MITNFPERQTYNLGGYVFFSFAPVQYVSTFPVLVSGAFNGTVVFKPGYNWLSGYATRETLSYMEEIQPNANGTVFTQTLNAFVPGDSESLADLLTQMADQRYILLFKDSQGVLRLAGSPAAPLDFIAGFNGGALRSDKKGYALKFSGLSTYRAGVYNG